VAGQIEKLLVKEGDVVARDQLVALLSPRELAADQASFVSTAQGLSHEAEQAEAALRYQEQQTELQIRQAEATLGAAQAQAKEAAAQLANAASLLRRTEALAASGSISSQEVELARTQQEVATAHAAMVKKQAEAQRSTVALARSTAEQVSARRSALASISQRHAAAEARAEGANVRLAQTELRAPVAGIVDVRAARQGEVVSAGQPVVSIINPDDLWIRVDVEETFVPRIQMGNRMRVRLPSNEELEGTVFYRGLDADFATQRDVSRSKRDIKTFEIRLRVRDTDHHLAVGMTAYVVLPLGHTDR
jgi:multidrug resistance efflux pump